MNLLLKIQELIAELHFDKYQISFLYIPLPLLHSWFRNTCYTRVYLHYVVTKFGVAYIYICDHNFYNNSSLFNNASYKTSAA
jgi:hypothetical protein